MNELMCICVNESMWISVCKVERVCVKRDNKGV